MNKNEILETIRLLGRSQGMYSRLYSNLMNMGYKERDTILSYYASKKFNSAVDFVMFVEG